MGTLKAIYVGCVRGARGLAKLSGVLGYLERRRADRLSRWARSLFAIYDIDDLVELDMPWWNLDAIDVVDRYMAAHPGAKVFEYGSGASSVWFARRAGEVISVDHDKPWHDLVASRLGRFASAKLMYVPPDDTIDSDRERYESKKGEWRGRTFRNYVHAIDVTDGLFDVVVIDGRCRGACLEHAVGRLSSSGIIVFDNSRRKRYQDAIEKSRLPHIDYSGLTACLPYPDCTTVLAKDRAVLAALLATAS